MDEILHQLGELVIGSLPTVLLFLVLVLAYQFLVHGPLTRMLAERRDRTTGAVEKAHAAIAAADARAHEYEAKLRAARIEVLKAREQRIQQWNAHRDEALNSARQQAQERIQVAKTELEAEVAAARKIIEGSADQLAGQILKAVLMADLAPAESTR